MDGSVKEKNQPISPASEANILSKLVFWWVNSFMWLGYKKDLDIDDVYKVMPNDESQQLGLRLQREWDKEVAKYAGTTKGRPSLTKALFRAFGLRFMLLGLVCLTEEIVFKLGQPLCLGQLVQYFDPNSDMSTETAFLYATGVVLAPTCFVFMHHPYFFQCCKIGMHLRVAACSLVYRKCLRLSQKSLGQTTIGQMVNIMSNDVNRFDNVVLFLHYLWVGPLQAITVTIILLFVLGPSCLMGLAVLILFVPLQSVMGRVFSIQRMKTAKRTDERVRTMNEIVTGMRVIKMYTWEKPFAKLIALCRKLEVNVIRRTAYFRALNNSLFFTSSKTIIFLTLIVYVLTGNPLTSEKVFLLVALFNNISVVITLFFPSAISTAAEGKISIQRVEEFLLLDEITSTNANENPRPQPADCLIECEKVTVKWPAAAESEGNTLTDVSFTIRPGKMLAVVGQVGSGKSSLLNVILGELSTLSGKRTVRGKIAYASQEPWIFSATIRQNILCGANYDHQRYNKVVKAAALERDFSLFPYGDQTAVGERGVSLSGGQKARINLARCLYVDADIYLLDDPLSAVDTHVGRHLFDEAINTFLRDKIRVLVTHQLQYLKDVDQILVLQEGRIAAIGTYDELCKSGLDMAKVVEEDEDEDEEYETTIPLHIPKEMRSSTRPRSGSKQSLHKRRSSSVKSKSSVKEEKNENKPAFSEETRQSGRVRFSTYGKYLVAGGGYWSFALFCLICIFTQVLYSAADYWLNIWTNAEQIRAANLTQPTEEPVKSWEEEVDTYTGIYVYSILICGVFVFSLIRTIHFFLICMLSSIKLHNQMFDAVIRAPLVFFDRNPVGRILNRFTKDVGCIDDMLPQTFFDVISISLVAIGILVVVGIVNLWLLLPVVFLAAIFYKLRQIYLKTARNVKRLESTTRSPVFTHLSSSLVGLTTLRAHNCQDIFQRVFDDAQDLHSSAWYMFLATTRWFAIRLDWICVFYIGCVTYTCTGLRHVISSSEAGLAISSAMALTGMFQWGVRQSAETENQMTSVERIIEYGKLTPEAALESSPDKKPRPTWPHEGSVQFDGMSLRYNESDQPVLKNISCLIKAREKIGIVGRTGAGKSSLIASLFRLAEPEGRISIDGIDSKSIGLHDLRSKISIIPQDPFLFSGTLRRNLDPFDEYSDEVLWNALEDVKLKESLADLEAGLDSTMTEGGTNLSVGQRQLVCLARAIVRRNRILVLDEATANVDQKTDSLIQLTIREKFVDCTVLTIAHRLNTIMDSDRVMVLDAGCLIEFDEPVTLLENPKSVFYSLVEQTGTVGAAELTALAREAAQKRRIEPVKEVIKPSYENGTA